jgi:siroheme synthase (precorrin-2 oxidase/ferrochelatase)
MTNSAHGGGDVLIPSVLKRPGYSVTVSSEGRVPAFPPYVVRMLDDFLDPSYDSMLDLLMRVRPVIRERIATQPERAKFLADILENQEIWAMLREGKEEEAFRKVMADGGIE